ncbi:MAG: flagellar biosynthesis anti-sigma factor FlgM [FCB group bacterium]|nr:flagellar biosynthesis anti-sigma factor FlgM [FCB group bacterium]
MQHTDKVVRDKLAVIPDVRMEKVQAAKAKLSEGFYNRGENIEEAADAFLKQSPAADEVRTKAAVNELMNKMDELPEARNEEVSNAKNRAYLGEYNREEPIRKVSDNLWIPPLKRL